MYCENCGSPLSDDITQQTHCTTCGKPIETAQHIVDSQVPAEHIVSSPESQTPPQGPYAPYQQPYVPQYPPQGHIPPHYYNQGNQPPQGNFPPNYPQPPYGQYPPQNNTYNIVAICVLLVSCASLFFSMVPFFGIACSIAALIVSIIAYNDTAKKGKQGRTLCITAICISGVAVLTAVVMNIFLIASIISTL